MLGPRIITGGGRSSLDVIVKRVLAEADPASLTAEHTTTVPESCTVVFANVRVDLPSDDVDARNLSFDEPANISERSPSIDQNMNGGGLPCPRHWNFTSCPASTV